MNTMLLPLSRSLCAFSILLGGALAFSPPTRADDYRGYSQGRGYSSGRYSSHSDYGSSRDRRVYSARPSSSFTLSFGNGYAGSGYYYGPPQSPYYYDRSGVHYYATRSAAPREYYSGGSTNALVQRALASRGYYHGSIDGAIGSQSRRAIASYQQDRRLRTTGTITDELLRSLGIR